MLIRSSTITLLVVTEVIKAARITGTFPIATSQPTGQATAAISNTAPDWIIAFTMQSTRIFRFSER